MLFLIKNDKTRGLQWDYINKCLIDLWGISETNRLANQLETIISLQTQ